MLHICHELTFVLVIAKHMRWGRQEDAHEFLRYVIDAMQKSCLAGQSNRSAFYRCVLLNAVMQTVKIIICIL